MSDDLDSRSFRLLRANYSLWFLLLGIGALSLSSAIPWELGHDVVRDAGIAALVGVYLMWTLERINKLRVQTEVQEYVHSVGENFIKAVYTMKREKCGCSIPMSCQKAPNSLSSSLS